MGGLVSSYDSNADAPPDSLSLLEAIERKSDRSLQALAEKCVAYRERYPDDTARHVALRLTDRVQSPLRPVHGEYTLELDHRGLSLLTRGSSSFSNSNEPLRSADILLRHGLLVIAPFDQRNISFYAMCVTTILYQLSPEALAALLPQIPRAAGGIAGRESVDSDYDMAHYVSDAKYRCDPSLIYTLSQAGLPINRVDRQHRTPLIWALKTGNMPAVQALIACHVDPQPEGIETSPLAVVLRSSIPLQEKLHWVEQLFSLYTDMSVLSTPVTVAGDDADQPARVAPLSEVFVRNLAEAEMQQLLTQQQSSIPAIDNMTAQRRAHIAAVSALSAAALRGIKKGAVRRRGPAVHAFYAKNTRR